MFWLSIAIILSSGIFVAGWKAIVKVKEDAHTERFKLDVKADQVIRYNEFLESMNQHMVSNQLLKAYGIVERLEEDEQNG